MASDQMMYVNSSKVIVSSRATHNHHRHLTHGYQVVVVSGPQQPDLVLALTVLKA